MDVHFKWRANSPSSTCQFRPCADYTFSSHIEEDGSSLCSLTIQTLTCSRNAFTDTPRNDVLPALWASISLAMVTNTINHPNGVCLSSKCAFFVGLCQADGLGQVATEGNSQERLQKASIKTWQESAGGYNQRSQICCHVPRINTELG